MSHRACTVSLKTKETELNSNVTAGNFELTTEQRRFMEMLSAYPRFTKYWDFTDRSVNLDAVDQDIGVMSHGEQIMLRFFVSVWLRENRQFDLIEASRFLDEDHRRVIADWFAAENPLFP